MKTNQNSNHSYFYLICIALFAWCISSAVVAEIAVIANPDNSVNSLKKSQVRALFLKKMNTFPNGEAAIPVDQTEGADIRDLFGKKVLRKNPMQLEVYWAKKSFSGKATPLVAIGDGDKVKAYISKTINSIGYIDASKVDDSVKVLFSMP